MAFNEEHTHDHDHDHEINPDDYITLVDDEGNEELYQILLTFESEEFEKSKDYLSLNDYNVTYSGCKITATVNRLTDELVNLNYYKAAKVTADMTGAGTLEAYGDVSVMFTLEDKAYYEINWESGLPTSPIETEVAE